MDEVIVERIGALARLRLNRPSALNALTHGMLRTLDAALARLEADPTVSAILLTGEGARGLCAGGDIRSLYEAPRIEQGPAMAFWRDEYRLDARIAHCPKPFIAWMDGLVMGGGVGISAHAAFRVVTPGSKIALPECAIGFVPDVGATWLLPRAPGHLGTWMGMTGASLGAADAQLLGLADVYLLAEDLPQLISRLAVLSPQTGHWGVADVLGEMARDAGPAPLAAHQPMIDRVFDALRVEDILAVLADEPGEFAAKTKSDLQAKSPMALKLARRLIHLGSGIASLEAALELEYAAARALVTQPDFYEGIRAAIIDKDRCPIWQPAHLAGVSDDWVTQALTLTNDRVFPA